jgi:methionyl-tRNA formyltransferase
MATVDLAIEVMHRAASGALITHDQDHSAATYCLWRDRYDFFFDWRLSASEIFRCIRSLGFPYEGAKGVLNDKVLTIKEAKTGPDLPFAIRDPGKLWQIAGQRAQVVCGGGTLWIEEAYDRDGVLFQFKSLRSRFLTADNAWIAPFLRTDD